MDRKAFFAVFAECSHSLFYYWQMAELEEQVVGKDTEAAELRNQIDDLQYELQKVQSRNDKLENHLAEAMEKLKNVQQQVQHQTDEKSGEKDKKQAVVVTNTINQKKVKTAVYDFLGGKGIFDFVQSLTQ